VAKHVWRHFALKRCWVRIPGPPDEEWFFFWVIPHQGRRFHPTTYYHPSLNPSRTEPINGPFQYDSKAQKYLSDPSFIKGMTNMKSLIFYPLLSVANELLKEPILNCLTCIIHKKISRISFISHSFSVKIKLAVV
jgi:hypothetical protein